MKETHTMAALLPIEERASVKQARAAAAPLRQRRDALERQVADCRLKVDPSVHLHQGSVAPIERLQAVVALPKAELQLHENELALQTIMVQALARDWRMKATRGKTGGA